MGSLIDDLVAPEFEVLRVTRHEEAARKWRSSLVPATSSSLPATPPTHQLSESKPVTSAATGHGKGLDSAERDYQKHNKLEDVIAEQLDTLEKLAKEKAQVMVNNSLNICSIEMI